LENPDVGGRIILIYVVKTLDERVLTEYGLAENRDRWRALTNPVIKLLVPRNDGNLLTSWLRNYKLLKKGFSLK
jgi:hypothetical protein